MSMSGAVCALKLSTISKDKILVLDIETTGFGVRINEILQITILDGSGNKLFDSYIKPIHLKRWPIAERVNHITYDMVEEKPTFSDVRKEIQNLFNNAEAIVGYNVNFDINTIEANGIIISGHIFDVMTIYNDYRHSVDKVYPKHYTLTDCAEYFNHSFTPHNAFEDAKVTLECLNSMLNDPRFTISKAKIGSRPTKRVNGASRRKKHPSIVLRSHRRKNIAFFGLFLVLVSEVLMYLLSSTLIDNINEYFYQIKYLLFNWSASWSSDSLKHTLYIAFGVGCVLIVIGLIQMLIRLPRYVVNKVKHLISKF